MALSAEERGRRRGPLAAARVPPGPGPRPPAATHSLVSRAMRAGGWGRMLEGLPQSTWVVSSFFTQRTGFGAIPPPPWPTWVP